MAVFGTNRRVVVLAIARMADSIGNSFLAVAIPLYIASDVVTGGTLGLGVTLITGLIISMYGFFNSVLQPFLGNWSDRTGKRKVFILAGLAILLVANFAYSLAGGYIPLLAIRAAQGVGAAFTIPGTIALVNESATDETRGGNMGVFNTFRLIGFGVGPIIAGGVIESGPYSLAGFSISGFDAAFYIAAAGALVSFVLVSLLVTDTDEETTAEAGEEFGLSVFARETDHLLDPLFTLGAASLFMAIGIAFFSTIETQVNAHLNQSATLFGLEFGAFILAQVVLQTPIGSASDEYGRKQFIVWGLVILVPATFAQGLVTGPLGMVVARIVQGVAGAMVFAPALALGGDLADEGKSGTQLSVLTMAFGLGSAIGPLSAGVLVGYGYIWPFAFAAVLAAIGAVLVFTQVDETLPGVGSDSVTEYQASTDD